MFKKFHFARMVVTLILLAYSTVGLTQEKIEGLVTSTKLTMCSFKPGGCAGNLVLDVQHAGKTEQVAIKVPLGTQIKKGNEYAYLPALRGNMVTINLVVENGEKVARSIDVIKPAKP